VATTGGGGAGAVRVSGAPSGGVSGAGAAADDVGSVIDFLSGAGLGRGAGQGPFVRALTCKSTRRWLRQVELNAGGRLDGCAGKRTVFGRSRGAFRRLCWKTHL
jgi:hypothetical protein